MTTIGAVASQPQPSAPPVSPPANTPAPAPAAPAVASPPASDPAKAPAAPASGTPDWRALKAGDDPKRLEVLARYGSEADYDKAFWEQRNALSKRAEPVRLADNATPEQIAEYRKGLGVAEVAKDAPAEKFIEAYGIKAPEGYAISEVEKGMLGDYAKLAYAQGHSPREVKSAVDFFFQQQAAGQQAMNKISVDRQKQWQGELRESLGRDFEPTIAAAEAYLQKQFADKPDMKAEILNAQLPGGGFLGDNPAFISMVAELARGNGFTDRLEASSLESGGKSLQTQRAEIEGLLRSNPQLYNAPETQARLDKLIALQLARGEIDEWGNPIMKRAS